MLVKSVEYKWEGKRTWGKPRPFLQVVWASCLVLVLILVWCMCVHAHVYVHVYVCVCMRICACVCTRVYMCMCVHVYMCMCVRVYMCMCVYACLHVHAPLWNKYSESGENKNRGFKNIDIPICRNTFCQILWGAHWFLVCRGCSSVRHHKEWPLS